MRKQYCGEGEDAEGTPKYNTDICQSTEGDPTLKYGKLFSGSVGGDDFRIECCTQRCGDGDADTEGSPKRATNICRNAAGQTPSLKYEELFIGPVDGDDFRIQCCNDRPPPTPPAPPPPTPPAPPPPSPPGPPNYLLPCEQLDDRGIPPFPCFPYDQFVTTLQYEQNFRPAISEGCTEWTNSLTLDTPSYENSEDSTNWSSLQQRAIRNCRDLDTLTRNIYDNVLNTQSAGDIFNQESYRRDLANIPQEVYNAYIQGKPEDAILAVGSNTNAAPPSTTGQYIYLDRGGGVGDPSVAITGTILAATDLS